jgi:hypothetical protein
MAVRDLQELQRRINTESLRDNAQMVQGIPARGQAPMSPQQATMMQQQAPISDKEKAEAGDKVLKIVAMEGLLERAGITEQELNNSFASLMGSTVDEFKARQSGGLIGMAAGGGFSGKVPGQGHGMEDNVYMPIVERQEGKQVATLAVSPDEYVVDAHTMSALGNGNADEGARYMDSMVKNIRQKAFGTDQQPNEINGLAALRPMIERV